MTRIGERRGYPSVWMAKIKDKGEKADEKKQQALTRPAPKRYKNCIYNMLGRKKMGLQSKERTQTKALMKGLKSNGSLIIGGCC